MKHFETREAAKVLDLPESRIRACVRAGFLNPRRGPGRAYQFSFQDLIVLRTTKGLLESGIPPRTITRLMGSLRRQLSDETHLASVSVYADGRRVLVWDGRTRWEPDSGQFLFNFDAASVVPEEDTNIADAPASWSRRRADPRVEPPVALAPPATPAAQGLTAEQWFDVASEIESESPLEARAAYERAVELDPGMTDALVNLGRLEHEAHQWAKAEAHYRAAADAGGDDPVVWFNLGVLYEDLDRRADAIACYRRAIARDADYADAHYNLGLILDEMGHRAEAMKHLMKARRIYNRGGRGA